LGYAVGLGYSVRDLLRAGKLELAAIADTFEYAAEWQRNRDQNLARMCVNEYAAAIKKGRR